MSISKDEHNLYKDGDKIRILAIISEVKLKTTKNNKTFAFVNIEDMYGTMEMMVFGSTFEKSSFLLTPGNIVEIKARISVREDEEAKLICEEVIPLDKINKEQRHDSEIEGKAKKATKNPGLYIKVKGKDTFEYNRAILLLSIFEGNTPVYIFLEDEKKLVIAPRKLWVSPNDVLIKELKNKIGERNIVIKK